MSILVFLLVLLAVVSVWSAPSIRVTRDIEDKVKHLDPMTKRRVLAMHAAGVPNKVIAEKVAYVAGKDSRRAARIVEGIKKEADNSKAKSASSSKPKANSNIKKTNTATKRRK